MSANVADSYRSGGRQLAQQRMGLITKQRGRRMIVWLIHCKEMDTWIKVGRVTSHRFQSQKPPLCKNANNRAALGHHCVVRRIKQRRSRELSLLRRHCAISVFKKKKGGGCPETHYANKGELKGVAQQWDYAAQTGNNDEGQRNENVYFGHQKLNWLAFMRWNVKRLLSSEHGAVSNEINEPRAQSATWTFAYYLGEIPAWMRSRMQRFMDNRKKKPKKKIQPQRKQTSFMA